MPQRLGMMYSLETPSDYGLKGSFAGGIPSSVSPGHLIA